MCHDVLVSSFLCPIGSTFSQKLLTCDWWTKVDCSSSNRYLAINRNNYQIDDDEMIRNAYAMISLQSAEDVTKDGLVDPDSGARIIDYSALIDRTMDYTSGFRRITDYPSVDATGNDLPNGFEDYSHQNYRQIVNYDHYQQKGAKTSPVYQSKYHLDDKGRSPYHAAPIIQHDYQARSGSNEFQNDYRNPNGFTNRLQASYAPTVPTVTTTTRRFYSPTVPTTYRPSTLAYSKLDLLVDSSDHLYAHSKSLVTPPTIGRQNDDSRDMDSSGSETRHGDLKKSESTSSPRMDDNDRKDDDVRSKDDEVRLNFEEKSEVSFRINVTDMIDGDELFKRKNDRSAIKDDSEESLEDIETKDSIGIARALNNLPGHTIVQNQNPIDQTPKDERKDLTTPPTLHATPNRSPEFYEESDVVNSTQIIKKSDVVAVNETSNDRMTENYEDITNLTTRSVEERTYTKTFGNRTTSLLINKNQQQNGDGAVQASIISVTTNPVINTTERSIDKAYNEPIDSSSSNDNRTVVDQNSSSSKSVSSFNDGSATELDFRIPQPVQFLQPPSEGFFISVPEEMRYTTFDDSSKISWSPEISTTEISRFSSTLSGSNQEESSMYNENIDEQPLIDYVDDGLSETSSLGDHHIDRAIDEISTPVPWLISTWHNRAIVDVPVTDIVPPIVDYNDGFGDFVPPDRDEHEHSRAAEFDHTKRIESQSTQDFPTTPKNNSEMEILSRYNTEFQFTIRDAIKAPVESKVNSELSCSSTTSDKQARRCETSSAVPKAAVSTLDAQEETISIDNKTTTRSPEQLISSGNTKSSEKTVSLLLNESSFSTTPSPITVSSTIDTEQLVLKMVTPRDVSQIKEESPEEKTKKTVDVTTANSILHSTRPGSLKQIEETIDRHNSPYQVSLTLKKDEDLETTADDFISRLIAQHQQSTSDLKEQADDFEIIRSTQPEIVPISQTPSFSDTSHTPSSKFNNSVFIANDTVDQSKELNSNVSMLSLLQLMAELLKLDRLPRPFSAKELHNVELETSLDLDESSFVTASPLFDYSQIRKPFRNADPKPLVFDTLKIPADIAEPKTLLNLNQNEASFVTTSPLLDHSQTRTPYRNVNSRTPSFHDISKTPSNVAFKPSPDISFGANSDDSTKSKTSQSETENRTARPLYKHEILEQLTENFGQPLYRGDSIHRSLVFDLPQVQRNLDFETGVSIEETKHIIDETEKEDPVSFTTGITTTQKTTTTTVSEKTIVETEFVPSLGFSFDTNEGREEYVEAILGGLIHDHTHDDDKKESGITQLTDEASKNKTLEVTQQSSKDV